MIASDSSVLIPMLRACSDGRAHPNWFVAVPQKRFLLESSGTRCGPARLT